MSARVPMALFGGPGDGAQVRVQGDPLPEFVTWSQTDPLRAPNVSQFASRPDTQGAAVYQLNRASLRYVFEVPSRA